MTPWSLRTVLLTSFAAAGGFAGLHVLLGARNASADRTVPAPAETPHLGAFMASTAAVPGRPAKPSGYCVPCGGPKSDADLPGNVLAHGPADAPEFELTGRLPTYRCPPHGATGCPVGHGWAAQGRFILLLGAAPMRLSGVMVSEGNRTRFVLDQDPTRLRANQDGGAPAPTAIWKHAADEALATTAVEVDRLRGALPPAIGIDEVVSGFRVLSCTTARVIFAPVASVPATGSYDDLTIRVSREGRVVGWERIDTAMPGIERHFRMIAWVD